MLRYSAKISVYRKDEESNQREIDFPHDAAFIRKIKEEISFLVNCVHLVDDEGEIYVLSVSNIEVMP